MKKDSNAKKPTPVPRWIKHATESYTDATILDSRVFIALTRILYYTAIGGWEDEEEDGDEDGREIRRSKSEREREKERRRRGNGKGWREEGKKEKKGKKKKQKSLCTWERERERERKWGKWLPSLEVHFTRGHEITWQSDTDGTFGLCVFAMETSLTLETLSKYPCKWNTPQRTLPNSQEQYSCFIWSPKSSLCVSSLLPPFGFIFDFRTLQVAAGDSASQAYFGPKGYTTSEYTSTCGHSLVTHWHLL